MKVPLASTGLRNSDIEAAIEVLKSGKLTMGEQVKTFEAKMSNYLGVDHFVMVNSGSSANLLMIEALLRPTLGKPRLNPGDGVLVPAIAWPTTIWPLIQLGLNPVFVDVDPETLAIDLTAAQELIDTTRIPVSGIFPIHPLGYAIPPSKLKIFTAKNDLVLVNDVCESLGSWSEGIHAGTFGVASSYSFYFSHHITTMEGGGVATNDASYADDLRSMRSHGWSRDRSDVTEWTKESTQTDSKFLFVSTGYNVRPMEIQAAIGIQQINEIGNFVERRRKIAGRVNEVLKGSELQLIGGDSLENQSSRDSNSWMLLPLKVTGKNPELRKVRILEKLEAIGVETRPVLTGNFLSQPAIQRIKRSEVDPNHYKTATEITKTAFLVGAHHDLSNEQVDYLCEALLMASRM